MFWNRVKQLMKERTDFTQRTLSETLGYQPRTLEQWISREMVPDAADAVKIAQLLNTTVEYLVLGNEPEIKDPRLQPLLFDLQEILNKYSQ